MVKYAILNQALEPSFRRLLYLSTLDTHIPTPSTSVDNSQISTVPSAPLHARFLVLAHRLTRLFKSFGGGRSVGDVLLTDMELLELLDHRK